MNEAIEYTRARVRSAKENMSLEDMTQAAERMVSSEVVLSGAYMSLREALEAKGLSVIGEVCMSPDDEDVLHHLDQASAYEWADAAAITVPTEPRWLGGSNHTLLETRNDISVPIVRRDFIVDAYQIYEAKHLGADGLTIDASLVDGDTLKEMIEVCSELFIDAIVEVDGSLELAQALEAGANIVGMSLDALKATLAEMEATASGTPIVPKDCLLVVGPGISSMDDARFAREHGACGVMVGKMFACIPDEDERQDAIRAMTEIE